MKNKLIITALIGMVSASFIGQQKDLTIEDSELGWYKGLYPQRLSGLQWLPGGNYFSYTLGDSIVFEDVKGKKSYYCLDEIQKYDPNQKYIPGISWIDNNTGVYFAKNELKTISLKEDGNSWISTPEGATNYELDIKNNQVSYTLDNGLFAQTTSGKKQKIFHTEDKNIVTGEAIHRFEFGISKGQFWSKDGSRLAYYQKDESLVADYPLLDINATPGGLNSIKYPMAGQKSEHGKVYIFDMKSGKNVQIKSFIEDKEHFYTNLSWTSDDKYVLIAEVNRDQNHMWLNQYDASNGKFVKTLFEEESKEWTEPEHPAEFIPNTSNDFLWFSERDGFMNLYRYNINGKLLNQVTDFKWVVQSIIGFSEDGSKVYIEGTSEDARQNHCYEVYVNSGEYRKLTQQNGTHSCQLSSNGKYLLDTWSSTSVPGKTDLIDIKKGKVKNIFTAENPLNDYNLAQVEYLTLKSEDGFDLYGRIMKPHDFDPSKKYPVLVYVYGGPHAQLVTNNWLGGARLWMHYMAEQGYIVFTLDGRGSANRGYDFEKVIHRNLGKNEVADQMVGVEYLKSLDFIDTNRMAVHGWSFGGFMTTSLMLKKPGTFQVGVAGGPVIDWKWYEIMYGERYMDTPDQNPEGYAEARLQDKVKNLEGDLLMIHGSIDDVVVMQHNLAFVQSCVSEGVQIDFFPYPMHKHNVRGKDRVHLTTKILTYILENNK